MIGYTFGLYSPSDGVVEVWENDGYLATFSFPSKTGDFVGLAARNATASVGSFEAWTHPLGSLVWVDDFASLGGWSDAYNGAGWSASSGRAVHNAGHNTESSVLVRDLSGARYFVLRDLDFSGGDDSDRWVMIDAFRAATGRSDQTQDETWKGYRLFVRDDGAAGLVPGSTEDLTPVGGTIVGGWTIGVVE